MKINHIKTITLGTDSKLELVSIDNIQYVLKTFMGHDAMVKKNREVKFHAELKKHGFLSFDFYYPELLKKDQICIQYIPNFVTFADITDIQKLIILADYLNKLHTKVQSKVDYHNYYDWLIAQVKQSSAKLEYINRGIELIEEFRNGNSNLTLLHSDFHENNIGLVDNQILLFDSGHCPFIWGHKYHDISRLILYYPDNIIFEDQKIWPKMVHIYQNVDNKKEFLKFCYIQSLLVYDNQWITKAKAITEHLYSIANL